MTDDLKSISDQQLFDRYIALAVERGERFHGSNRLYNRCLRQIENVVHELDARELDLVKLFAPVLKHENPWVRISATRFCYDDMPEATLAVLRELSEMTYHPLGPRAAIVIDSYAQGYRHKKLGSRKP